MLSEWLKNNKAKTLPSGEKIVKADPKHLTKLQESYNVYEPIEEYDQYGQRSDLPPLNVQWKQDWKRRLKAIKKHEENKQ